MTRAWALAALALAGCSDARPGGPVTLPTPRGPVVARVDGEAVTAAEVESVASGRGLSARDALDVVIVERLEAREARRSVVTELEVRDALWRARVQALLAREIEARVTPESLPEAQLRAALDARRADLLHGPTRDVMNFVAHARPGFDARAAAERFHAAVVAAGGARPTREQFAAAAGPPSEDARVEALPPFDDSGRMPNGATLVPAFVAATRALTESAPLSAPFETNFGWHVALLVGVGPASTMTSAEAEAVVRRELVAALRAQAARALVEGLRARAHVQVSASSLEALRHIARASQ
ncbi:MAG: hypothetical protein R3A52_05755 [Polyangiales bacterium]